MDVMPTIKEMLVLLEQQTEQHKAEKVALYAQIANLKGRLAEMRNLAKSVWRTPHE